MAGHSKWHNIKHRKAAVDAKRGKMWSKCAKAIMVAARNGGPDPESNLTLRYAIDEARYANMPRDTIDRAIKKGSGELGAEEYENVRYEGYGPGGVAVIVDALTNNRTRTAGDVRLAFARCGGNLGTSGCVAFMFESRGRISVPVAKAPAASGRAARREETRPGIDADRLMELAIEAGALDVVGPDSEGGDWVVVTSPTDFLSVKQSLEAAGVTITDASIDMVPTTTVAVAGESARKLIELVEILEDNDDVQKVYANFEIPDEELARMG
jgi:YebC/PmpR family DNA-binding regulatory protein